jgi:hypothetical protein
VSLSARESRGARLALMLSSTGWGSMEATGNGIESGSRRNVTSRGPSRCLGSSFWEKVMVAETLSFTVIF